MNEERQCERWKERHYRTSGLPSMFSIWLFFPDEKLQLTIKKTIQSTGTTSLTDILSVS